MAKHKSAKQEMIKIVPISNLKPYAQNPRKNDHAISSMAALIKEFGFKVPILARSSGEIVDGHLRYKAAQILGLKTVPVLLCDHLTEAQTRAFRLAINKSAEWAEWDEDLLRREMAKLEKLPYDLTLTGFSDRELDTLLASLPDHGTSTFTLGSPPSTIQQNIDHMHEIRMARRAANESTASKNDTERYLVIVFPSREAREQKLHELGLPIDERYITSEAVCLRLVGRSSLASERKLKAASKKYSCAAG